MSTLKALCLSWVSLSIWAGCGAPFDEDLRVFRYNESANLNSLDPAAARTLEPMWVVDQIFDGLVELDVNLQVRPLVAESFAPSDSGRTWTFVLRTDVHFAACAEVPGLSEGRRVVADDVVYSLNRLRDPAVASAGRWILDPLDVHQAGEGIEAIGTDTVVFRLTEPFSPFLGLLATAYANIVPREAVEYYGPDFRSHPVGSGPFKLAWWMEDVACVLHKNPLYWEKDDRGAPLPYLDAVHISFVADLGAEYQGLLQGRYDFMSGLHPAYMEEILTEAGELQERHAAVMRMERMPFLKTDYIGFNLDETAGEWKPWHDDRVRRALSLATDREGIARTLRRGTAVPTSGFVPPALLPESQSSRPIQNLPKAQALLATVRNEHPSPWPPFVISTTPDYADLCAALQYQWQSLGIDVEVDVVSASTQRERVANGKADLFRKSWLADYPDAENFLSLFRTLNFAPGGPNYTHFSDAEFDAGMEQAVSMTSTPNRLMKYAELHQRVMSSMPVIPIFHDQVTHFLRNEVTGWEINAVNRLDLRRVQKIPIELASNP